MGDKIFKITEKDKQKIRELVIHYTTHKCSEGVIVYSLEKILNNRGRYTLRQLRKMNP